MRYARLLLVMALGSTAIIGSTAASADPPVEFYSTGIDCRAGDRELARNGSTRYCYDTNTPKVQLLTPGDECDFGYDEYSVGGTYGLCVDWDG